jgi:hypothetical protein
MLQDRCAEDIRTPGRATIMVEALGPAQKAVPRSDWSELWRKEDWWAIWLGLGVVLVAFVLYLNGASLRWIAVTPARWSTFSELGAHFSGNVLRYLAQFALWLAVFTVALTALGYRAREFIPSFAFLYLLSVVIFAAGQWRQAS